MTFFEWFYKAVIVQGICVLLILTAVLAVKYFFVDEFKQVQNFYDTHIAVDTDINEVLQNEV